jgi:hypothetical protein
LWQWSDRASMTRIEYWESFQRPAVRCGGGLAAGH